MATRSTVCPDCQASVPGGRLSCPSCGHLLASVTGRRRSPRTAATSTKSSTPTAGTAPPRGSVPDAEPSIPPPTAGAYIPPAATPAGPFLLPARAWAGITSATTRPMLSSGSASAMTLGPLPATQRAAPAPAASTAPAVATATDDGAVAEDAPEATWLEATAGWLMIIGSAVAILGFLLPWSRTVIGADGVGSYFDSWGIANPSHILVVLGLAAALGLAIVANPVPTWIRTSAVGLGLGGLLVGLTWPYLMGPLGAGPGVLAILVGGIMVIVAGLLDLFEARHAAP